MATLGLRFVEEESGRREGCFAPIDLLDYIYAVLYHPSYREQYFECLKIEFPRIPYPSSPKLFWDYVEFGKKLRSLHLLEENLSFSDFLTQYNIEGDNLVESVKWIESPASNEKTDKETPPLVAVPLEETNLLIKKVPSEETSSQGRVYINSTQYFEGVPLAVWNYFVGGHQPAQKWLKDRKGEKLSAEDLMHYQRIIVTLQRTIELTDSLASLPLPPFSVTEKK